MFETDERFVLECACRGYNYHRVSEYLFHLYGRQSLFIFTNAVEQLEGEGWITRCWDGVSREMSIK